MTSTVFVPFLGQTYGSILWNLLPPLFSHCLLYLGYRAYLLFSLEGTGPTKNNSIFLYRSLSAGDRVKGGSSAWCQRSPPFLHYIVFCETYTAPKFRESLTD
ncbi:hypothetical protein NPIL_358361 [Nephila pilipes]|uniref:Uncharacterized protein n=1 Tax=Nephila pilipes TaxID=299642 RepID=A0A8X6TL95_NEPPI|nr:hypothetical protein NPIL_358361 [Nephila pilipes]